MNKTLSVAAAVALIASISACSGGSDGDGRECLTVPDGIAERIAEGASAAPIEPVAIAAVRSEAFEDANIVAMRFTTSDGEDAEGVWAIGGSLDDPGVTLSIDAVAATVTDWPNQMDGEEFSITEDGAAEAKACLTAL